ncbi:MAG: hypothetical protein AB7I18_11120 [Candidatus Berkiella sp.]
MIEKKTKNDLAEILIKHGYDHNDFNIIEFRSGPANIHGIVRLSYTISRISNNISFDYDNHWVSNFIEDLESLKYGNP